MPLWLQAGFWGLLSGSALVIGAAVAWFTRIPARVIAAIMSFGSGVLISALSFDLMEEAFHDGGFAPVALGFLGGAIVYTVVNHALAVRGAKHRKRSGKQQKEGGNATAIAVGALLDGIPESIVIGVSLLEGHGVSWVAVVAIFLSNLPEGLSSAAGMKNAGKSARYVFGLWTGIALTSGLAALVGNVVFARFAVEIVAATQAVAAGAILTMLSDTMIPEAFEEAHEFTGLITVGGFLAAFALSKLGS